MIWCVTEAKMIGGYVLVAVLMFSDGSPPMFIAPQEMASKNECELAAADWRKTPPDFSHLTNKPIDRMYADCQIMTIDMRKHYFQ
jgi:hypothetical protein